MPGDLLNADWGLVVEELLKSLKIDFSVEAKGNTISIITDCKHSELIRSTLDKALSSRENFQKGLSYTISTPANTNTGTNAQIQTSTTVVTTYPTLADTPEEGLGVLERFIDPSTFKGIINLRQIFSRAEGATSKNWVLYSPFLDDGFDTILQGVGEVITKRFLNIDRSKLIEIWGDPNSYLPENPVKIGEHDTVGGLVSHSFGVISELGKTRLYFKFGFLRDLIFPVHIDVQNIQNSEEYRININRDSLATKITQLNDDNFIGIVYKNGTNTEFVPVIFPSSKRIAKPHHYVFIVDKSGSMILNEEVVRKNLNEFIQKLKGFDESARVTFVLFSSGATEKSFLITQTAEIESYLRTNYVVYGGTELVRTVVDKLSDIDKNPLDGFETVVMVVSDGKDNALQSSPQNHPLVLEQIATLKSDRVKTFFSCGVGSEYDQAVIEAFSTRFNTPTLHLKNMADFAKFYDYVSRHMQYEQQSFTISAEGKTWSGLIPEDGDPKVLKIVIPFTKPTLVVRFNGKEFKLELGNADNIPTATVRDILHEMSISVNSVLANDQVTAVDKKVQLEKEIKRLETLAKEKDLKHQNTMIKNAIKEVQGYIDELLLAIQEKSEHRHSSIKSQAKSRLNYVASTRAPITVAIDPSAQDPANNPANMYASRRLLSVEEEVSQTSGATRSGPSAWLNSLSSVVGLASMAVSSVRYVANSISKATSSAWAWQPAPPSARVVDTAPSVPSAPAPNVASPEKVAPLPSSPSEESPRVDAKREPFNSTFIREEISLDDKLTALYFLSRQSSFKMPWNRSHKLSDQDRAKLLEQQKLVVDLTKQFAAKMETYAFKHEVHADKFADVQTILNNLTVAITAALKSGHITNAKSSKITQDITRVEQTIPTLINPKLESELKKAAKKDSIRASRLERRGQKTGVVPAHLVPLLSQFTSQQASPTPESSLSLTASLASASNRVGR